MELRQLRLFLAVARHLHFSKAAAEMNLAQPHVSREIKRLETELRVSLFTRTSRQVSLTPAGAALRTRLETVLDDLSSSVEFARTVDRGTSGTLTLGVAGSVTYSWLPFLVKRYRSKYPDVILHIRTEMYTGEQVAALRSRHIDVGLLRPPLDDDRISTMEVAHEPLIAAMPVDHPLALAERPVRLESLREERFILFGGIGSVTEKAVLSECLRAGFVPTALHTTLETHSIVSLVSAGLGVAIVPHSVRYFTISGVAYRTLADSDFMLPLALAWSESTVGATANNFIALVRQMRDMPEAPNPQNTVS